MSDSTKLRPPVRASVRHPEQFLAEAAEEIRGYMATLGADGWSLWDIAAALDCGRTALWSWRTGAGDMPLSKFKKLKQLAAECSAKRKAVG
jgi:hypothetical protein